MRHSTDDPMDETTTGAATMDEPGELRRVDAVSLVAGLLFVAIALTALTDRHWVDVDSVLLTGGAIVAVGTAMIVAAARRHHRSQQHDSHPPPNL